MGASQAYAVVADEEPVWDADVAWRVGLGTYRRGNSPGALAAFDRAHAVGSTVDGVLLLAWRSAALLQAGQVDLATQTAGEAVRRGVIVGDDRALATAYISLSLCHDMSGTTVDSEELLEQAMMIADRAGDVVLRARVLINRTYQLLNAGRYVDALDAARDSAQCATAADHANFGLMALCNEGDALMMLGRYDEAVRQYERALARCRRMGSRRSAAAQLGLGRCTGVAAG